MSPFQNQYTSARIRTTPNMSMTQFIDFTVGCASDGKLVHVVSKSPVAAALHWVATYREKTATISAKRRAMVLTGRPNRPSENLL